MEIYFDQKRWFKKTVCHGNLSPNVVHLSSFKAHKRSTPVKSKMKMLDYLSSIQSSQEMQTSFDNNVKKWNTQVHIWGTEFIVKSAFIFGRNSQKRRLTPVSRIQLRLSVKISIIESVSIIESGVQFLTLYITEIRIRIRIRIRIYWSKAGYKCY